MNCWLCSVVITPGNDSREHVIPQAIGGRKTVKGFICKRCNNETGAELDASLLKFLEFITMFVNPSRGDGKRTPAVNATGDDGLEYLVPPLSPGKPLIPVMKHSQIKETVLDDGTTNIEGTFESEEQLRVALEKMKQRRYPKLDVEQAVASASWISRRPQITHKIEFNSNCRKSIAKTALALACGNGVRREDCQYAIDYLRRPYSADSEIVFFSDEQIVSTPKDWHSIFVMQANEYLVSFVSYYNLFRFCIILSRNYKGDFVAMSYAVDPTKGMEIDKPNWIEVFELENENN